MYPPNYLGFAPMLRHPVGPYQHQHQHQNSLPPSPAMMETNQEEFKRAVPGPPALSREWNQRIWALEVRQHPVRARMCGFGDKDRRPISPPPCIRLLILDAQTKQEINYEDVELSHLILTVDIFAEDGIRESNIVRHGHNTTCISSAYTGSISVPDMGRDPQPPTPPAYDTSRITQMNHTVYPPIYSPTYLSTSQPGTTMTPTTTTTSPPPPPPPSSNGFFTYASGRQHQMGRPYYPSTYDARYPPPPPQSILPPISHMEVASQASAQNPSHWTRNLIGSLCASAFRLKDENGETGIWFVLQDLSVRTDGWFRLKFNFFNVEHSIEQSISNASTTSEQPSAPCLAACFSTIFKVYSAKKFPGVIESTPLSKCFASQGIKIPIRKDPSGARKTKGDQSDEEVYEEDE